MTAGDFENTESFMETYSLGINICYLRLLLLYYTRETEEESDNQVEGCHVVGSGVSCSVLCSTIQPSAPYCQHRAGYETATMDCTLCSAGMKQSQGERMHPWLRTLLTLILLTFGHEEMRLDNKRGRWGAAPGGQYRGWAGARGRISGDLGRHTPQDIGPNSK